MYASAELPQLEAALQALAGQRPLIHAATPGNADAVGGTSLYLDEAKGLDRNIAIIFAASDRNPERRPRP